MSLFEQAVKTYGAESQVRKAVEELTELSVALLHSLDGRGDTENIREEMADVEIMLEQLHVIFGYGDYRLVKELRLAERLRDEHSIRNRTRRNQLSDLRDQARTCRVYHRIHKDAGRAYTQEHDMPGVSHIAWVRGGEGRIALAFPRKPLYNQYMSFLSFAQDLPFLSRIPPGEVSF